MGLRALGMSFCFFGNWIRSLIVVVLRVHCGKLIAPARNTAIAATGRLTFAVLNNVSLPLGCRQLVCLNRIVENFHGTLAAFLLDHPCFALHPAIFRGALLDGVAELIVHARLPVFFNALPRVSLL